MPTFLLFLLAMTFEPQARPLFIHQVDHALLRFEEITFDTSDDAQSPRSTEAPKPARFHQEIAIDGKDVIFRALALDPKDIREQYWFIRGNRYGERFNRDGGEPKENGSFATDGDDPIKLKLIRFQQMVSEIACIPNVEYMAPLGSHPEFEFRNYWGYDGVVTFDMRNAVPEAARLSIRTKHNDLLTVVEIRYLELRKVGHGIVPQSVEWKRMTQQSKADGTLHRSGVISHKRYDGINVVLNATVLPEFSRLLALMDAPLQPNTFHVNDSNRAYSYIDTQGVRHFIRTLPVREAHNGSMLLLIIALHALLFAAGAGWYLWRRHQRRVAVAG